MSERTERLDLITAGDPELRNELVGMFFKCADRVISDLKQNSDTETNKRSAHELKGAADNLGFSDIATICLDIESNGKASSHIILLEQSVSSLKTELTN